MRIYLDHNATSPLRASVRDVMLARLGAGLNPSSVHQEGREGRKVIERARLQVAALVGTDPKAVTFTSGGTEANNTVLAPDIQFGSTVRRFDRLFVSAVEHPCVLAGGRFVPEQVERLAVDENGIVDLEALRVRLSALDGAPFVSVMLANNETGVVQPIAKIAEIVHERDGFLHCDAVQAAGKMSIAITDLGADAITLSAHKIGGPQGVGAVVRASAGIGIPALLKGGGQELGYRGGTENVMAIEGFGIAAEACAAEVVSSDLQAELESGLKALSNEIVVFGDTVERLPNTTCFAMPGKRAETALIAYDMAGIAVSSGSACSSGKVGASHVLEAMGVERSLSDGAIRVSTGWTNTPADIKAFLTATERLLR
ncbi:MAG: cysteine desulfurase family protein [Pseudomonadota bacterium]